MRPRTLYEKLWDSHVVEVPADGVPIMYVDRLLLHEVNSPQAFASLRASGSRVLHPESVLAMADHGVPTIKNAPIVDEQTRIQVETLAENCKEFGIRHFATSSPGFGITHVVGPEQGVIWPGLTVVCSDSHSPTYGAFGALSFGIGASEVESVLRSQTVKQRPDKTMRIEVAGSLPPGIVAKDLILAIIKTIGAGGGTEYAIEYSGEAVRALAMDGRMTLCNMSIEAGARAGLVAPDEITFKYLKNRPFSPSAEDWEAAVAYWRILRSDPGAIFDKEVSLNANEIAPHVTWGTSPDDVVSIDGETPDPADQTDELAKERVERALEYMGLRPHNKLLGLPIDVAFIGSCTNARLDDLRTAAMIAKWRHVAPGVRALVVPGSMTVKAQAEAEGLDRIFLDAGFEWREAGCSMCNAMNGDFLKPQQRCASASNRNFEGRQGPGGRVHLMSPAMVAAAAVSGRLTDIREMR
jgi:3-isopropylmalate/(R)-2-methylmalate dehydratase large subunit